MRSLSIEVITKRPGKSHARRIDRFFSSFSYKNKRLTKRTMK